MAAAGSCLCLLAACSSAGSAEPAAGPVTVSPTAAVQTTVAPTTPAPSPTDAARPPESPEPATAPPPATAGPLGMANLPTAVALGNGWRTYDDPGGAEQGFQGNQAWTRRRDPHQAAFEALPIGCAHPLPDTPLPVPRFALQGSYRNARGGPATALVLRFSTAAQASSYFAGYGARLRACGAPPPGTRQGLAVRPLWSAPGASAVVRRYLEGETFVEVSVLRGRSVGLLATSSTDPAAQLAWTRTVAPRLSATVDR